MTNAMTCVTGTGAMSIMNNTTKLKNHFVLTCPTFSVLSSVTGIGGRAFAYKLLMTSQNHCGLIMVKNMPIRQPGETGPKPIIAKMAKMKRHFIWVKFMAV